MMADIVEVAVQAGNFKTLVAAVQAAGLVDALKQPGPFTVFAPTDDAFAKLPPGTIDDLLKPENKDKLVKILTYHVVAGKYMCADVKQLPDGTKVPTLSGESITVTFKGDDVYVDGAKVIAADVVADNGVIHVIDAVILPPNL
ncbi:fasciclin domain-containing protein [Fervidibacter sacchari]|nr:fasciclin domain-containing protein [Candidatus Fervidibacter sacchari]